ncbi:hypothetical protein [Pandoraea apista]|uniref:hypothetical protein n=1 Tax=Pandoraea apista TaxID=93218 RepID=UPI003CC81D8A
MSAGYEYRHQDRLFSPYGWLSASRSTLDQYSETDSRVNALGHFKPDVKTSSGTLGIQAGFVNARRIGTLSPDIRDPCGVAA